MTQLLEGVKEIMAFAIALETLHLLAKNEET